MEVKRYAKPEGFQGRGKGKGNYKRLNGRSSCIRTANLKWANSVL